MKLNSVVHFPFYQMFKLFILDLRGFCLMEAMPLYNTAVATQLTSRYSLTDR